MVSYKNLFLIKGMTCWNGTTDWVRRISTNAYSWYEWVASWFDPDASTWYLLPGGTFPVSHRNLYGLASESVWVYRPHTKELIYHGQGNKGGTYTMAWLSARTTIKGATQDMDAFMGELRVYPNGNDLPLSVLLQAWSLYDRRWWSADSSVRTEWIDRMADEHSVTGTEMIVPLLPCSVIQAV